MVMQEPQIRTIMASENVPSTTTIEEDRHSAGQRGINKVWEYTQSIIALSVVSTTLYANVIVAIYGTSRSDISASALVQLDVMAALAIGFYFGRTNDQRI